MMGEHDCKPILSLRTCDMCTVSLVDLFLVIYYDFRSRNGEVLLTEREQSSRWVEHFNEVFNQDSPTDMFDFRDKCELGMIDASLEDIKISETIKALRKLKNNKAAGLDEITAELLKHGKEFKEWRKNLPTSSSTAYGTQKMFQKNGGKAL